MGSCENTDERWFLHRTVGTDGGSSSSSTTTGKPPLYPPYLLLTWSFALTSTERKAIAGDPEMLSPFAFDALTLFRAAASEETNSFVLPSLEQFRVELPTDLILRMQCYC